MQLFHGLVVMQQSLGKQGNRNVWHIRNMIFINQRCRVLQFSTMFVVTYH